MATIFARGTSRALRAISIILPKHTKRLVLWSTLYGKLSGSQNFTKEQCERLNGALALCKDNNALTLPGKLGKFIWNDLDDCTIVACKVIQNEKTSDAVAMDFIRSIPVWLRYASDAFMLKDFQLLMTINRRPAA